MAMKNAATKAAPAPEPAAQPVKGATDTLAEQEARKRRHFINDPQFQYAEQFRQVWIATIAGDHRLEDLMRPEYWRNVANKIRHYAHIECYAETGAFYAELLVVGKSMNAIRVALLKYVDLNAEAATIDMGAELQEYRIHYAGPTNGFRVIYLPVNRIIKERLMSEDEARTWLLEYLRRPDKGFMEDRKESEPVGLANESTSSAAALAGAVAARKAGANA